MKSISFLVSFLSLALAAETAFACGAPFGSGITVDPKQDIIIGHKDGIETYVFQPRFCGAATDFGLVLPIPGRLAEIPALVEQAVFTQVDTLTQPKVTTKKQCKPSGDSKSAGGSDGRNGGVSVTASGQVGFLDWAELKADTESALTAWLTTNGFPYDSPAVPVFQYYAQKGWYFLAFKINLQALGASSVCKALGPVKVVFPSAEPVVPSRMGAAGKPQNSTGGTYAGFTWRIFGITPGDRQLTFAGGTAYNRVLGYSGLIGVADAQAMSGLAVAGDRLTRLNLTFSNSDTVDVGLALAAGKDFREEQEKVEYEDCLFGCAFGASKGSAGVVVLGLGGIAFLWTRRRRGKA
jgi:hypothetical protein